MAMIKRPFSRALYEAYDGKAKDRLADYLESVGHTIVSTKEDFNVCLLYTSPSPRDGLLSRMPSSA